MGLKPAELFSDATDNADLASKWDAFQKAMIDAPNTAKGDVIHTSAEGGAQVLQKSEAPMAGVHRMLAEGGILNKALDADTLASITSQLESSNVNKDFTLTNPLGTGYVAYDLEAPAKMLFPKPTPIRNRTTRGSGVGVAHQFKMITGVSGSQGGPRPLRPGITDSTVTSFGPGALQLNRGQKIAYQGAERSIPYLQFGLSDSVPFSAQFAGQGFMDARSVSRASLLFASMVSEERLMLGGRGTAASFSGALAAPGTVTAATRAPAATETAITGFNTSLYVKVTAKSIFGESVLSAAATVAIAAGQVCDVTVGVDSPGALGYNVYVSTGNADPGDAQRFLATSGGSNVITIQGVLPTAGIAASSIVADTSASSLDYDGILSICAGTGSGYTKRLNGLFSGANPGGEFQAAFAAMWNQNLADPDEVLLAGQDRKQLSDLLKTASTSNYRIQIQNGSEGQSLGNIVTGLLNEVTGSMVDLTVHPYLPQGNAPILSHTLPFADSNVGELWTAKNVQDYMAFDWPVIQNSYDASTYWFGTFFCYAPAWQGCLQGIKAA